MVNTKELEKVTSIYDSKLKDLCFERHVAELEYEMYRTAQNHEKIISINSEIADLDHKIMILEEVKKDMTRLNAKNELFGEKKR